MNDETTAVVEKPIEAPAPAATTAEPKAAPAEAPKAAPAAAAPAEPKDRAATLREVMIAKGIIKPRETQPATPTQAAGAVRGPDGKFAPSKPAAAQQTQATAQGQPDALPRPASLKKELDPLWQKAPRELQQAIIEREAASERGIAPLRERAQQAEALLAEFKPYERVMQMTGGTPQSALRSMLPTMAVLATGSAQEKAYVMAQALRNYGIPLEHIAQVMQGGVQAVQANPQDQMFSSLQQQIAALTQSVQSRDAAQAAAENARIAAIADAYGRDKPQFDSMRPQMWSLLQAQTQAEAQGITGPFGGKEQTALWSEQQWIENAYNAALRLNPDAYQAELARQREAAAQAERDKATQAAQASRAAAVQVRGAPSAAAGTAAFDPKDRRSVIAAAVRARA